MRSRNVLGTLYTSKTNDSSLHGPKRGIVHNYNHIHCQSRGHTLHKGTCTGSGKSHSTASHKCHSRIEESSNGSTPDLLLALEEAGCLQRQSKDEGRVHGSGGRGPIVVQWWVANATLPKCCASKRSHRLSMVATLWHPPHTVEKRARSPFERKERMLAWASSGCNSNLRSSLRSSSQLCPHSVYIVG
jgi:hypothetical protein